VDETEVRTGAVLVGDDGRPGPAAGGDDGTDAAGVTRRRPRGLAAPLALPAGFAALLIVGAVAAGTHGGLSGGWVLGLAAGVVLAAAAVSEAAVVPVLAVVGWLTVIGFSRAPYAQLQPGTAHAGLAALVIAASAAAGLGGGLALRRLAAGFTLWIVDVTGVPEPGADAGLAGWPAGPAELDATTPAPPARAAEPAAPAAESRAPAAEPAGAAELAGAAGPAGAAGAAGPAGAAGAAELAGAAGPAGGAELGAPAEPEARRAGRAWPDLTGGIGGRRLLSGVLLVGGLPLLTLVLSVVGLHRLGDDLLVYLAAVVGVAIVGGFWPAVLAAITASLLVNWYFTPPVHTLTIGDGQSLLALLLFVTVAVTVSSVVHLAALRAGQAARAAGEAQELLALAQTVLGGADDPAAVLAHLTGGHGGRAELLERTGGQWIRVAASGAPAPGTAGAAGGTGGPARRAEPRADLALVVTGQRRPLTTRLLDGFAAQAAAALDRDRLRTQAAQAEALVEGDRMRTALLAAVSHDLRTPLASIKASVSTLRQTDVDWSPADEAALLATIERSSDRLDALIGNLLDMSRLTAGSLQPFLRPTALDEVAPVALRGLDAGPRLQLMVPDDLPLVRTDPGLLERVLANLFANALAYSPAGRDPELRARPDGGSVLMEVIDHGCGVPEELREQMFEPFQRLRDRSGGPAAPAPGGIGLGLTIVRGFLAIMGGSVQAAGTPGGGLTMRVRLPAADPAEITVAGPGHAGRAARGPAGPAGAARAEAAGSLPRGRRAIRPGPGQP
jgi:signal transduction histidine kinase